MKNVYNEYELENDVAEAADVKEELPQFMEKKAHERKGRRVEYDEKGRVRKDYSFNWLKVSTLVALVALISVYVYKTCGADLLQML